jgi:hypothetical protein
LPRVDSVVEVIAPLETVWSVLTDPTYITRLYPDAISTQVEPAGTFAPGQTHQIVGRAGRRRLEILTLVTEIEPQKKIVIVNRPGGLFKAFEEKFAISPTGNGIEVRASFEFELSTEYMGEVFNLPVLEGRVGDNFRTYTKNLKDLCELVPVRK